MFWKKIPKIRLLKEKQDTYLVIISDDEFEKYDIARKI